MTPVPRHDDRSARPILAGVLSLTLFGLAGCSGTTTQSNPVRSLAQYTGLATDPGEVAEFVRATRPPPNPNGFIPIGVNAPARPLPVRDGTGAKSLEAALGVQGGQAREFANRPTPAAAPARPAPTRRRSPPGADEPPQASPETYPVSPSRLRGMRGTAQ